MSMEWKQAVYNALQRYSGRHQTKVVKRQRLIEEEMSQILIDTNSQGRTPGQTLSRILQELQNDDVLHFSNRGEYVLIDAPISVENEDLDDDVLDAAIRRDILLIEDVPTGDEYVLARRRRGQERLRRQTLDNYQSQCALCDIADETLLVTSHIVRWADDPRIRGNLSNTICLCRFHDVLFEAGYISFTDDMQVIRKNTTYSETIEVNMMTAVALRLPVSCRPSSLFVKRHRIRCGFEDGETA